MPSITIRNLSDEAIAALDAHAYANKQSRESWVRGLIEGLIGQPIVKLRYQIKAVSPEATVVLDRGNQPGTDSTGTLSKQQQAAQQEASVLVMRNLPGDRERAIAVLQGAFEHVFEIGV